MVRLKEIVVSLIGQLQEKHLETANYRQSPRRLKMILTTQEKSDLLDKLVTHAETIEKGEWIEGKFLSPSLKNKIKSHAIWFLKIFRGATADNSDFKTASPKLKHS